MRNINYTNVLFLAFAAILLLLAGFSYQKSIKQAEASDWVMHSQQIKIQLTETYVLFLTAETNQRGFLLTKDSAFLSRFHRMKLRVIEKLEAVKKMVIDNREQHKNIDDLITSFQKRYYWMEMVVEKDGNIIDSAHISLLQKGQVMTHELAGKIEFVKNREDKLLNERIALKKEEARTASTFILLLSVFSVLFITFAFFRLKKETKELNRSNYSNEKLEQKIQERTLEIKAANLALEEQNIELQRKNDELSSFTFVASHDLKEPLRKIDIYSGMLIDSDNESISNKGKEHLQKLIGTVARMKVLLEAIFTYAQTGKNAEFETVDLNETAALAVNTLHESILEKDASIEYEGLPVINAIRYQMEQLFTNIISNALKYAKQDVKPHIKIEAKKTQTAKGNSWEISFSDNGIGFDNRYKDKIFEIFQRLHGKAAYSGSGIGLAICKKIAENHNGSITAHSDNKNGAVFIITIPGN